jgi:ABC-type Na+ efflux pump permease subunit
MNNSLLVMKYALKNQLRLTSATLISVMVIMICAAGTIVLMCYLMIGPEMGKTVPDRAVLETGMGGVLFLAGFITIGVYSSVFTYQSLVREKARGNIPALLATPVRPFELLAGKTLAVFVPGFALTVVMVIAAFFIVNLVYYTDDLGFIVNPWMIISNIVAVPVLYLAVTLFVYVIGLAGKPGTANIIGQIFLPVMANVMIQLGIRTSLGTASWLFMVILFAAAVLIGSAVYFLRGRMVTETIMLSMQG